MFFFKAFFIDTFVDFNKTMPAQVFVDVLRCDPFEVAISPCFKPFMVRGSGLNINVNISKLPIDTAIK